MIALLTELFHKTASHRRISWCSGLCFAIFFALIFQAEALATNPPVLSVTTGVYHSPTKTSLTMTMDGGATTYYTTDGSTPSSSHGTVYSGAITLAEKNVIKAISYVGGVPSTVATSYIQNDVNAKPVPASGLQLWLKGDFGPLTSGSNVTDWVDLSGAGNNAAQATGASQPTIVSSGINDFPSLSFDGSNDNLALSSGFGPNLTTGVSIFAVLKPASSGTATFVTSGNSGPNDQASMQTLNTQAQFDAYNGSTSSAVTTASSTLTVGKFQILSAVHDGSASASININGNATASGTVQNLLNTSRSLNYLGANNSLGTFWNGEIAELLVYSKGVSVSERAAIEAYLAAKYQLSTAQSTPAPILSVATGSYDGPTQVAIAADADSDCFFTLDGTMPSGGSTPYSEPINIIATTTVKAIAIRNGISSSIATSVLTLDSTKWPGPDATARPLNLNLKLPTISIPQ